MITTYYLEVHTLMSIYIAIPYKIQASKAMAFRNNLGFHYLTENLTLTQIPPDGSEFV